ncbi:MAG: hypothetical protein QOF82_2078 [Frankiales bacterium]|jgi:hypothetical protein|nr:hypothetical protein [Frankiales bacterium]
MYATLATAVIEQRLRDAEHARFAAAARKLRRTEATPHCPSRRVPHRCAALATPSP